MISRKITSRLEEFYKEGGKSALLIDGAESGVGIPVYNVEEPRVPLKLAEKPNFFKLFMNDVGLLSAMYMGGIQVKILNGETEINFGSIYENAVAQELTAHGFAPTYIMMFLEQKRLPERMIYDIGAPIAFP